MRSQIFDSYCVDVGGHILALMIKVCCGEEMTELIPNTVDVSVGKHLSVGVVLDDCLSVELGSVPYPIQDGAM